MCDFNLYVYFLSTGSECRDVYDHETPVGGSGGMAASAGDRQTDTGPVSGPEGSNYQQDGLGKQVEIATYF